jgi:hypothetical protein
MGAIVEVSLKGSRRPRVAELILATKYYKLLKR